MALVPAPPNLVLSRWVFNLMPTDGPQEIAVFGLYSLRYHFSGNTVNWDTDLSAIADKLVYQWVNNMGAIEGNFGSDINLDHVDCYQIGPDGKVAHKGSAPASSHGGWVGHSDSSLPFQCSLAISTSAFLPGTFTSDRRSKQGRFYLPPMSPNVLSSDGRLLTARQTDIENAVSGFLNGVQGAAYPGTTPPNSDDYVDLQIYSQYESKEPRTVGQTYPLTYFRVGRVVDTQRRRRNKLQEEYVTGTVAHS